MSYLICGGKRWEESIEEEKWSHSKDYEQLYENIWFRCKQQTHCI